MYADSDDCDRSPGIDEAAPNPGDPGESGDPGDEIPGTCTPVRLAALVVVVMIVAALGTALAVGATGSSDRRATRMPMATRAVGPVDPATLAAPMRAHYEFAQAHRDAYRQIPCWCGCEQFLGHRTLEDCFIRRDGKGWEAHAAGCGVCIGEATLAEQLLAQGKAPADIKTAVDTQFGVTAITTPTTSAT